MISVRPSVTSSISLSPGSSAVPEGELLIEQERCPLEGQRSVVRIHPGGPSLCWGSRFYAPSLKTEIRW